MSNVVEVTSLFELELDLPNNAIAGATSRLIGFETRYQRIYRDLRLLADPAEVRAGARSITIRNSPFARSLPIGTRW